jgi:RNA polymerase sigma factor (sigma-70 family)
VIINRPPNELTDYAVTIRVRNGRLLSEIQRRGYRSVKQFCDVHQFGYQHILAYLSLKLPPYGKEGRIRQSALALCDALSAEVEDLFPPEFLTRAMARATATVGMTEEQLRGMLTQTPQTPLDHMIIDETGMEVQHAVFSLTPRQTKVLAMRFAMGRYDREYSLEEVGNEFNVTRERVRQIEQSGIRKLRNPHFTKRLLPAAQSLGVYWLPAKSKVYREYRRRPVEPQIIPPQPVSPTLTESPDDRARRTLAIQAAFEKHQNSKMPSEHLLNLLRKPGPERTAIDRCNIAAWLEDMFAKRGAGPLKIAKGYEQAVAALDRQGLLLAKYDWYIENLETLGRFYPPAIIL